METPLMTPVETRGDSKFAGKNILKVVLLACVLFILALYFLFIRAPFSFREEKTITVVDGSSLREVSTMLKKEKIIQSRAFFEALVIFYDGERKILPGDYVFQPRASVFEVARVIYVRDIEKVQVRVTIPEGFDVYQIADTFSNKLKNFNPESFLIYAKDHEGYFFPDTYFFFSADTEEDVIKAMSANFANKIKPLKSEIEKSSKSEHEIIVMASIIEREAQGNDRELISGILWKRIAIGMPLQADAAPETYKEKGLPQKPIANPGILAIRSAINPKKSPYLYYLHDKSGVIHFAKTFSEHRQNIQKYLK